MESINYAIVLYMDDEKTAMVKNGLKNLHQYVEATIALRLSRILLFLQLLLIMKNRLKKKQKN